MRTTLIVFLPPCLDQVPCLLQIEEPVGIQTFTSQGSVEAFNEGVVFGLPGLEKSILALLR